MDNALRGAVMDALKNGMVVELYMMPDVKIKARTVKKRRLSRIRN